MTVTAEDAEGEFAREGREVEEGGTAEDAGDAEVARERGRRGESDAFRIYAHVKKPGTQRAYA